MKNLMTILVSVSLVSLLGCGAKKQIIYDNPYSKQNLESPDLAALKRSAALYEMG